MKKHRATTTSSAAATSHPLRPVGPTCAAGGLDLARLENVHHRNGKTIAACPACREDGRDENGNHLVIQPNGRFGCIAHQGPAGHAHRQRIYELSGKRRETAPTPTRTRPTRTWASVEDAARGCTPAGGKLAAVFMFNNGTAAKSRHSTADGKTFRFFHQAGDRWAIGAPPEPLMLYGVEHLPAEGPVLFVEGEGKVDALRKIGVAAVSSAYGSSGEDKTDFSPLAGRDVAVLPDNDEPGRRYAAAIAAKLAELDPPARVKILDPLPGPVASDVVDWLEERDAAEPDALRAELAALVAAAPVVNGDPFPRWTLADLEAYQPDPASYIAGDGWLRSGASTLLTGGTGQGKSVLAVQIAVGVAAGRPVLGVAVPRPRRVLILEAENDQETMRRDVLAVVKHLEADRALVERNLIVRHVYGLAGAAFGAFLAAELHREKSELVVVDPFQSFVGGGDLNSTAPFLAWAGPADAALRRNGCGLLLTAHAPKPSKDREGWNVREGVYLAAGSSALANWCRCSCELTPAGKEDRRFRLRFSKNAERTGLVDDTGRIMRELYVEHSGNRAEPFWRIAEDQGEPSTSEYEERIIELATAHPSMSVREIARQVGCSKSTAARFMPRDRR